MRREIRGAPGLSAVLIPMKYKKLARSDSLARAPRPEVTTKGKGPVPTKTGPKKLPYPNTNKAKARNRFKFFIATSAIPLSACTTESSFMQLAWALGWKVRLGSS